jgi:hypothetical protein
MHQNTFLTTPDIKKYLYKNLILGVWKYAQWHQNTFLTAPDVKKLFFKDLILVVRKCIKTGF